MMIVRAKLHRVYSRDEGTKRVMAELYPRGVPYKHWSTWRDGITAQKVLTMPLLVLTLVVFLIRVSD